MSGASASEDVDGARATQHKKKSLTPSLSSALTRPAVGIASKLTLLADATSDGGGRRHHHGHGEDHDDDVDVHEDEEGARQSPADKERLASALVACSMSARRWCGETW